MDSAPRRPTRARAPRGAIILAAAWGLVALGAARPASAQGDPVPGGSHHRLAVEAAGLFLGLDDLMASPVRYTGGAPALGLGYAGGTAAWRWSVRVAGSGPRLTSRLTTDDAGYEDTVWGAASAQVLRRVWTRGAARVWIGPGVTVVGSVRRHMYAEESWLNYTNTLAALQAAVRAELELGRAGRLTETIALPVAGVAFRKAQANVIRREQVVLVGLPPALLVARHRLEYRVPARGSLGGRFFHEAILLRHSTPRDLAAVVHRVGAGVDWFWGAP